MIDLKLNLNDKIDIINNNKVYKSNVQDITQKYIAISVPVNKGKYAVLHKENTINVNYIYRKNVYQFESKVIGRKIEVIPVILISIPKEIIKIQRRESVRVSIVQNINYKCLKDAIPDEKSVELIMENDLLKDRGILLDLSGKGAKIKTLNDIFVGDIIVSKINLEGEFITIKGKVTRVNKGKDKMNICGVKFIDMPDSDSEKIIKYTFQVMREQLTKRT